MKGREFVALAVAVVLIFSGVGLVLSGIAQNLTGAEMPWAWAWFGLAAFVLWVLVFTGVEAAIGQALTSNKIQIDLRIERESREGEQLNVASARVVPLVSKN